MTDNGMVYQVVAARRIHLDALLWQVPALSLSAQAFLFTIALGNSTPAARVVAATLSVISSVLSILLMAKHRAHQNHDSQWLEDYEKDNLLPVVHSHAYFGQAPMRWWVPRSLYPVWLLGLALFGVAALWVIAVTAFAPGTLDPQS